MVWVRVISICHSRAPFAMAAKHGREALETNVTRRCGHLALCWRR